MSHKNRPVFGVPINEIFARFQQEDGKLPSFVDDIIKNIKEKGLLTEQLFLSSDDEFAVEQLKKKYNKKDSANPNKYSSLVFASVLKRFLIELPEPLLTEKFRSTFLKTQGNPDNTLRYRNLRKLVSSLPQNNRIILQNLLSLFRLVLQMRHINLIDANKFYYEMGPILLGIDRIKNPSDSVVAQELLKSFILQYAYILGYTEEPASIDNLPVLNHNLKQHKLRSTADFATIARPRSEVYKKNDFESVLSLEDCLKFYFLDTSVHNILFEPKVRITQYYESKIPPNMKLKYAPDRMLDKITHRDTNANISFLKHDDN